MARIRVPGIFYEEQVREQTGIGLGETGVPAFLGVAERGPLNEPTKIRSFEQYRQVFGVPVEHSFLADAVEGFFKNGGKHCFVIRIAHVFRRGDGELARKARYEILDRDGYPAIEVTAASEGAWGNEVILSVAVPETARVRTFLTLDSAEGAQRATVQSTRGFEPGMLVCLSDGQRQRYVTLSVVRTNELFWKGELDVAFKSSSPTYIEPVEFELSVRTRRKTERFVNLSLNPGATRNFARVINSESELIRVVSLESASPAPLNLPEQVSEIPLRGGRDGLDGITPEDFIGYNNGPDARFGLGALEPNTEVDLVAAPDLHFARHFCSGFKSDRDVLAVQVAMLDHCERLGDRFALLDMPAGLSWEGALDWRLKFESAFGAIYYPWLVLMEKGERKAVPPVGHLAGVISRCDREDGVHRAPANVPIEGVVDTAVVLQEGHVAELNHKGINCIRPFAVRGIRPWGARTLSHEPAWKFLTTRRIFNAVRRAVFENTQWVVFETNGTELRRQVTIAVQDFLRSLWSAGYFKGRDQDQAFYVLCDESNNPLEDLDAGRLLIDIGLAPSRPAEFISLRLEHTVEDRRLGDLSEVEG
ncbi:MAG: phage tail sheath subtilisin-like domain-containing protein [Myxococcota bacterium]|jgi:hypothetical protein|nr:phage tail sheath subtilisin-like domain-containing protein [Myxococcota bacterium]